MTFLLLWESITSKTWILLCIVERCKFPFLDWCGIKVVIWHTFLEYHAWWFVFHLNNGLKGTFLRLDSWQSWFLLNVLFAQFFHQIVWFWRWLLWYSVGCIRLSCGCRLWLECLALLELWVFYGTVLERWVVNGWKSRIIHLLRIKLI